MNDRHNTWKTRFVTTLMLLPLLSSTVPSDAGADEGPTAVIEAVTNSPAVQAEVAAVRKRIKSKDSGREEIKVIETGGGCGFAGCSASYLAVVTVHRGGSNPQSASVFATVTRPARGKLGEVSVVEIKKKAAEPQRNYSSLRGAR